MKRFFHRHLTFLFEICQVIPELLSGFRRGRRAVDAVGDLVLALEDAE